MKKFPTELQNYTELIAYLRRCLAQEGVAPRPDIASWIVGIIANEHYDEWCNDPRFPEFRQLFNIACDMELPDMYEREFVAFGLHDEYWAHLKAFVDLFEKKFEIWPRLKTIKEVVEYLNACFESERLREHIAPSILGLRENERVARFIKNDTYPELNEIIETAARIEKEWDNYGLKVDGLNRIHQLVIQLNSAYNN